MEEFTVETIISFQEYLKDKKVLKKIILVAILLIAISLIVFIKDLNIIFLFASMSIFILYLSCIIGCLIIIFYYYCYNKNKYSFKYSLIFHKNYIERKGNGINEKISFDDIIEMTLPGKIERKRLLEMTLSAIPVSPEINLDSIAEQMEGFSAANVVLVAQRAAKIGILSGGKEVFIEHFSKALKESIKF